MSNYNQTFINSVLLIVGGSAITILAVITIILTAPKKTQSTVKDKCELKYDSLLQVKSCYCKKLEFLDTLSDKEIETAFKKSRCKIL